MRLQFRLARGLALVAAAHLLSGCSHAPSPHAASVYLSMKIENWAEMKIEKWTTPLERGL